jgi:hypothetical protein
MWSPDGLNCKFAKDDSILSQSNHPKDKLSNFQQRKISLAAMNICGLDSAVELVVARGGLKGTAALLYISGNATPGLTACAGGAKLHNPVKLIAALGSCLAVSRG